MRYEFYNENCLDTMDGMLSGSIDVVVTSPPYDNLRVYKGYSFEFEAVAQQLYRVIKLGGVLVWIIADSTIKGSESGTSFRQALLFKELGFNLHDTMIYAKNNYIPLTHNRYEQMWEFMFVFSKGKPKTFNPIMLPTKEPGKVTNWKHKGSSVKEGGWRRRDENVITASEKIKGNIWYYSCGASKIKHPAPFPEQLAVDHILSWSNPGDTIYDPFAGSGTTLRAALQNNRIAIGSEIAKEYFYITLESLIEL